MLIDSNCKYLIDSNCFIEAKNSYYNPNFCSQFWNVMRQLHAKKILYSIDKVKNELLAGEKSDYARVYIAQDVFFKDMWIQTSLTSAGYKKVVNEANNWYMVNVHKRHKPFDDFMKEAAADAYLLATAYDHGYTIITQEVPSGSDDNKRIKIPNMANTLNIKYCNIYTILQKYCNKDFSLNI